MDHHHSLARDLSPNKGKKFLSIFSNMIVTVEFVHRKGKNGSTDQDVSPLGTLEGTVTLHSQTNSKRDDNIFGMSKAKLTETGKNLVSYDEVLLPFEIVYAIILHDNDFPSPKEKSCSGNSVLYNAVRPNTQVLIKLSEFKFDPTLRVPNLSNNHKVLASGLIMWRRFGNESFWKM